MASFTGTDTSPSRLSSSSFSSSGPAAVEDDDGRRRERHARRRLPAASGSTSSSLPTGGAWEGGVSPGMLRSSNNGWHGRPPPRSTESVVGSGSSSRTTEEALRDIEARAAQQGDDVPAAGTMIGPATPDSATNATTETTPPSSGASKTSVTDHGSTTADVFAAVGDPDTHLERMNEVAAASRIADAEAQALADALAAAAAQPSLLEHDDARELLGDGDDDDEFGSHDDTLQRSLDGDDGSDVSDPTAADIVTEDWREEERRVADEPWRSTNVKYLRVRLRESMRAMDVMRASWDDMTRHNVPAAQVSKLEDMYTSEIARLQTKLDDSRSEAKRKDTVIDELRQCIYKQRDAPEAPSEFSSEEAPDESKKKSNRKSASVFAELAEFGVQTDALATSSKSCGVVPAVRHFAVQFDTAAVGTIGRARDDPAVASASTEEAHVLLRPPTEDEDPGDPRCRRCGGELARQLQQDAVVTAAAVQTDDIITVLDGPGTTHSHQQQLVTTGSSHSSSARHRSRRYGTPPSARTPGRPSSFTPADSPSRRIVGDSEWVSQQMSGCDTSTSSTSNFRTTLLALLSDLDSTTVAQQQRPTASQKSPKKQRSTARKGEGRRSRTPVPAATVATAVTGGDQVGPAETTTAATARSRQLEAEVGDLRETVVRLQRSLVQEREAAEAAHEAMVRARSAEADALTAASSATAAASAAAATAAAQRSVPPAFDQSVQVDALPEVEAARCSLVDSQAQTDPELPTPRCSVGVSAITATSTASVGAVAPTVARGTDPSEPFAVAVTSCQTDILDCRVAAVQVAIAEPVGPVAGTASIGEDVALPHAAVVAPDAQVSRVEQAHRTPEPPSIPASVIMTSSSSTQTTVEAAPMVLTNSTVGVQAVAAVAVREVQAVDHGPPPPVMRAVAVATDVVPARAVSVNTDDVRVADVVALVARGTDALAPPAQRVGVAQTPDFATAAADAGLGHPAPPPSPPQVVCVDRGVGARSPSVHQCEAVETQTEDVLDDARPSYDPSAMDAPSTYDDHHRTAVAASAAAADASSPHTTTTASPSTTSSSGVGADGNDPALATNASLVSAGGTALSPRPALSTAPVDLADRHEPAPTPSITAATPHQRTATRGRASATHSVSALLASSDSDDADEITGFSEGPVPLSSVPQQQPRVRGTPSSIAHDDGDGDSARRPPTPDDFGAGRMDGDDAHQHGRVDGAAADDDHGDCGFDVTEDPLPPPTLQPMPLPRQLRSAAVQTTNTVESTSAVASTQTLRPPSPATTQQRTAAVQVATLAHDGPRPRRASPADQQPRSPPTEGTATETATIRTERDRYMRLWKRGQVVFKDAMWCVRDENATLREALAAAHKGASSSRPAAAAAASSASSAADESSSS